MTNIIGLDPLLADMPRLVGRFWAKVDRGPESACWLWTASTVPHGYGQFMVSTGRPQRAHRVAWQIAVGPIPDGMAVCHRCDIRLCVNPGHLFLGTQLDNIADMNQKGRARGGSVSRPGEAHPSAKLTQAQVEEVRRLRAAGITTRVVAVRFGISASQVCRIARGERWKAA